MNIVYWGIEFAATFIESLLCFVFCGIFIDKEKLKTKKILIFIMTAIDTGIIILLNTITLFSEITSFISIILMLILQYIVYKNPVKILIFVLTYFAMLTAIDFSIIYSIAYVSEMPTDKILLEQNLIRVAIIFLTKTLLAIIMYAVYKLKINEKKLPNKYLLGLFVFSVLIIFLLLFVGFKDVNGSSENLNAISVLFFVVSLCLILMFFFGIVEIAEFYENKQQMTLLTLRNQMLETSMAETEKTFSLWQSNLHDHKHNIIHLLALAKKNDVLEIEKELEKEVELLSQKLFYYKTGNDTVDAILYVKQTIAKENNIPFLLNIGIPKNCPVSDVHLCAILGNLIDNAINASKFENEPYIEIGIKQMTNFLIIKILNRFTSEFDKESELKKNQNFHGIGLKSVGHIVKSYDGEFTTTVENGTFTAKIMIPI